MPSQHPHPLARGRLASGFVALAATLAVSGCSALGLSDQADQGPPRISPEPLPEVAAAMVEGRGSVETRLNACKLLDLTPEQVIELTGVDMPVVEPTGSGDLGLLCTYGGPGSPERYEMQLEESEAELESEDAAGESGTETTSETTTAASTTTSTASAASTTSPTFDPDYLPDTFAAGVVKPRGGPLPALRGQAAMLGVRYACSEIRGADATLVEAGALSAPEAPAPVKPELDTAYIDCVAAPAGGGVEVHTILVADNDLWHITLISPETPRSPEAEARALAGLHRVAEEILD